MSRFLKYLVFPAGNIRKTRSTSGQARKKIQRHTSMKQKQSSHLHRDMSRSKRLGRHLCGATLLLSALTLATLGGARVSASPAVPAAQYFVATTGQDANPGTQAKPFATLERARDAVRVLKGVGKYPAQGVTIWIRGGLYERQAPFVLSEPDEGTPSAPVIYAAWPGEHPRLAGGRRIPASAFIPADDAFGRRILEAAARRHILQVNLKQLGITDYGRLPVRHAIDFYSRDHYLVAPLELFVNGLPMTLARWPNLDKTHPRRSAVDRARAIIEKDSDGKPLPCRAITFADLPTDYGHDDELGLAPMLAMDRVRRWNSPKDVYVAGGLWASFAFDTARLQAVDPKDGTLSLDFGPRGRCSNPSQLFFLNVPEELDSPGEYYLDRDSGTLYLYPPAGWNARSDVLVSLLAEPLVVLENCAHTRLRGLTLEAGRSSGLYIAGGEDNVAERCEIRNMGLVGAQIGQGFDETTRKLLPCLPGEYRHALCTALEGLHPQGCSDLNRDGGRGNGLSKCRVHDTGCGGVLLGGGDRKTLTPAGNFVRDSEICRADRLVNRYAEAIVVDGVGNHISGNYLHDSEAGIVYIHGNDHIIEFNEITRAVLASADCGAIEIRQNPSQLGNKIRHNYLHDISRLNVNAQTNAIYLDNETCGVEISGNVFQRIGGRSIDPYNRCTIGINGGYCHRITNNVFVDNTTCNTNRPTDANGYKSWKGVLGARSFFLVKDVDVTQPPYSTRYPEFLKVFQAKDEKALWNEVSNNLFVNCPHYMCSKWKAPETYPNLWIEQDPGFVNWASGDLTLSPDSPAFKKLPGFQSIPFAKMRRSLEWESAK